MTLTGTKRVSLYFRLLLICYQPGLMSPTKTKSSLTFVKFGPETNECISSGSKLYRNKWKRWMWVSLGVNIERVVLPTLLNSHIEPSCMPNTTVTLNTECTWILSSLLEQRQLFRGNVSGANQGSCANSCKPTKKSFKKFWKKSWMCFSAYLIYIQNFMVKFILL